MFYDDVFHGYQLKIGSYCYRNIKLVKEITVLWWSLFVDLVHKSFEERLAEYNGEISVCDFDWGEPMGRELLWKSFLKAISSRLVAIKSVCLL